MVQLQPQLIRPAPAVVLPTPDPGSGLGPGPGYVIVLAFDPESGPASRGRSLPRGRLPATAPIRGLFSFNRTPIIMGQAWGKNFAKLLHTPLRSTCVDRPTPALIWECAD